MSVTKLTNGNYQARFRFEGQRFKRNFKTAKDAKYWEAETLSDLQKGNKVNLRSDKRKLSELVDQWFIVHGHSLKTGKTRQKELHRIVTLLGNPLAKNFKASDFAKWRAEQLDKGITANTLNHYKVYLQGVYTELERIGEWSGDNPLKPLKKLKVDEPDVTYLTKSQIHSLLSECERSNNPHLNPVVRLCLSTGSRWGEAMALTRDRVKIDRVTYSGTKNGQNRTIPVSKELTAMLVAEGNRRGTLFNNCEQAFDLAVERANVELPKDTRITPYVCEPFRYERW